MKCGRCGFDNPEGSLFCNKCGSRLASECPKCHSIVPPGSNFCNHCGEKLTKDSESNSPVYAKPEIVIEAQRDAPAEDEKRDTVNDISASGSKQRKASGFSFRMVGSILSLLIALISAFWMFMVMIETLETDVFIDIIVYLVLVGLSIWGIKAETKICGILVIIIYSIELILSLFSVYGFNAFNDYMGYYNRAHYFGVFVLFFIRIIPAAFMCVEPSYMKNDSSTINVDDTEKPFINPLGIDKEETECKIANGLTIIPAKAFFGYTNLKRIALPSSLVEIGDESFQNCFHLKFIYFFGTVEQWKSVKKGKYWDFNLGANVIHCSDGDVPI